MLKHILIETRLFDDENLRGKSQKGLLGFLESLTWWNQIWLEEHPEAPLLYQSGVKYALPEQFNKAHLPQVDRVREALKRAPESVRAAFDEISDMVGAGEHFRDFAALLENGEGDCLPVETLVQSSRGHVYSIGNVAEGDFLHGAGDQIVRVEKVWSRSIKSTISMFLDNGTRLVSSPEHRHMLFVDRVDRIDMVEKRASDIVVGDRLAQSHGLGLFVKGIEPARPRECVDITTSSGTFWLPETDVITHNCDNIACARAAEVRVKEGVRVDPYITCRRRADGGMTYHAIDVWPDGSSEDSSLILGMGGLAKVRDRAIELAKNEYRRWQYGRATKEEARERALKVLPQDLWDECLNWFDTPDAIKSSGTTVVGQARGFGRQPTIVGQGPGWGFGQVGQPTIVGQGPGWGFGQGVQYQPTFWTDDAFEDWRPGAPQFFWNDPRYAGGNVTTGPAQQLASRGFWKASRWDREDDEDEDDFDLNGEAVQGLWTLDEEGNLIPPPIHVSYARYSGPRAGKYPY